MSDSDENEPDIEDGGIPPADRRMYRQYLLRSRAVLEIHPGCPVRHSMYPGARLERHGGVKCNPCRPHARHFPVYVWFILHAPLAAGGTLAVEHICTVVWNREPITGDLREDCESLLLIPNVT